MSPQAFGSTLAREVYQTQCGKAGCADSVWTAAMVTSAAGQSVAELLEDGRKLRGRRGLPHQASPAAPARIQPQRRDVCHAAN